MGRVALVALGCALLWAAPACTPRDAPPDGSSPPAPESAADIPERAPSSESSGASESPGPPGAGPSPAGPIFVLVHGAWAGGWVFRDFERLLRDRGAEVYRPTLTGLGDRRHLSSPHVDLDTHVRDVANLLIFDELTNVVLVGHSYGGMVISGVVEEAPERIRHLVYLDAAVPFDGESLAELLPSILGSRRGDFLVPGWASPDAPYPKDVPQSLRTVTQPIELDWTVGRGIPATYVLTRESGDAQDAFDWAAERARGLGWTVHEMTTGHLPHRSRPVETADLLMRIAAGGG